MFSTDCPGSWLNPLFLPGIQPAVFAFPCATLLTMMLAFIMYMTLRNATHQKDMVEVGARWGGVGWGGWTPGLDRRGSAERARGRPGALGGALDIRARPQGWG